eukprot:TRINITY_DN3658_c0_g1_i1.p1 TRINITY_DN3658_c0_g1~~TRINITY_DN3658_c0_g1_i1.p1  ORF type:complete len:162 (+),score=16.46 TRINITY_DN3658_c0_g1_i1:26-511(+)
MVRGPYRAGEGALWEPGGGGNVMGTGEGPRTVAGEGPRGSKAGDGACEEGDKGVCCGIMVSGVNRGDWGRDRVANGEGPRVGEKCNGENRAEAEGGPGGWNGTGELRMAAGWMILVGSNCWNGDAAVDLMADGGAGVLPVVLEVAVAVEEVVGRWIRWMLW